MRFKWEMCLTLLLVLLIGCGAKTSADPKPVEHHASSKKTIKKAQPKADKTILETLKDSPKQELKYAALGDSLSVGLFSNDQADRFSSRFTKELAQQTHKPVEESNTSSVGKTVTNFGINHVQEVIAQNPDLITVEFGTNDAAYGIDPTNVNNFVTNLDAVVSQLKSQTKAQILLMTAWSPSNGKYIENDKIYDQKIKEIGQKYHVPVVDLSTIWTNNPDVTKNDLGYSNIYNIQKDEFHPNQQGHTAIADLLMKTVEATTVK